MTDSNLVAAQCSDDDLILVKATPDQYHATLVVQHSHEWGAHFDQASFLKREYALMDSGRSKNGDFICWVLVPRNDHTTTDYRCSCEVYKRILLVKHTTIETKIAYSIASVMTPRQHRGKKYAARLMTMLHSKYSPIPADKLPTSLPEEVGPNNGFCTFLFSDAGEMYSKFKSNSGTSWQLRSPHHIAVPIDQDLLAEPFPAEMSFITPSRLQYIIEADTLLSSQELEENCFISLPTADDVAWFAIRADAFLETLPEYAGKSRPAAYGVQLGDRKDKDFAFVLWFHDLGHKKLEILRLRASNPDQLQSLLKAAARHATEYNLTEIIAWNVDKELLKGTHFQLQERDHTLPMVALYDKTADWQWMQNERYAWC